jgi:hypothetical protein
MTPLALMLAFVSAADAEVVVPAASDAWPGEERKFHFGVGYRGHVGLMGSEGTPFLVLQSELNAMLTCRIGDHDEFRLQVGFAAGFPDTFAGETNLSVHWWTGQRVAVGIGTFGFWGFWSMRLGVEVPVTIRLDRGRRHELALALRSTAGVYNNNTFVWYDFAKQRFAISAELVAGYSFIF